MEDPEAIQNKIDLDVCTALLNQYKKRAIRIAIENLAIGAIGGFYLGYLFGRL